MGQTLRASPVPRSPTTSQPTLAWCCSIPHEEKQAARPGPLAFDMKLGFRGDGFRSCCRAVTATRMTSTVSAGRSHRAKAPMAPMRASCSGFPVAFGGFNQPNAVVPLNYSTRMTAKKSKFDTFGSCGANASVKDYGGSVKADIDMQASPDLDHRLPLERQLPRRHIGAANVGRRLRHAGSPPQHVQGKCGWSPNSARAIPLARRRDLFPRQEPRRSLLANLVIQIPTPRSRSSRRTPSRGCGQLEYNIFDQLKVIARCAISLRSKRAASRHKPYSSRTGRHVLCSGGAAKTSTGGVHRFCRRSPSLTACQRAAISMSAGHAA